MGIIITTPNSRFRGILNKCNCKIMLIHPIIGIITILEILQICMCLFQQLSFLFMYTYHMCICGVYYPHVIQGLLKFRNKLFHLNMMII